MGPQGVDLRELKRLMEQLNGQLPVLDEEVDAVVHEALLLSGSDTISRGDLMRVFLNAWASALLYGKEYHTILMERLRRLLPSVLRDLRRQRKAPDDSSVRLLSSPAERWMEASAPSAVPKRPSPNESAHTARTHLGQFRGSSEEWELGAPFSSRATPRPGPGAVKGF
eukprot:g5044.t1